jgi:hypothetical protein
VVRRNVTAQPGINYKGVLFEVYPARACAGRRLELNAAAVGSQPDAGATGTFVQVATNYCSKGAIASRCGGSDNSLRENSVCVISRERAQAGRQVQGRDGEDHGCVRPACGAPELNSQASARAIVRDDGGRHVGLGRMLAM